MSRPFPRPILHSETPYGTVREDPALRHLVERLFYLVEPLITAVLYPFCLLRQRLGGGARVPILMYHQIGRPLRQIRACQDCVTPERFERQMRAVLRAGYRVVPLARLVGEARGARSAVRGRCAVLTFDDGFRDQFVNAVPILRRLDLPATFFLIAGPLGRDGFFPHLGLDDASQRQRQLASPGWRPLSWDDASEMARNGFDIGSHSLSHRSLGRLRHEEVKQEARRSKRILEDRLGIRVEHFAYPFGSEAYGDFDAATREILRTAGYNGACTTVVGTNGPGRDPFALRRIPMQESDGPFRVRCKLAGAYDWVAGIKGLWQHLVAREDQVDALPLTRPGFEGS